MIVMNKMPSVGVGKTLIREVTPEEFEEIVMDGFGTLKLESSPVRIGEVIEICPEVEGATYVVGDKVIISRLSISEDRRFQLNGTRYSLITDPRLVNFILKNGKEEEK